MMTVLHSHFLVVITFVNIDVGEILFIGQTFTQYGESLNIIIVSSCTVSQYFMIKTPLTLSPTNYIGAI
jgi:hypothetical protein